MKKEFVIFLILISAGAVLIGATFVLVNEFPRLVEQWNENERGKKLVEPAEVQDGQQESHINPITHAAPILMSKIANAESQILTVDEENTVLVMLKSLGVNGENFTEIMKAYQSMKSIDATGVLTTETLEAIVRDLTISKISAL